MNPFKKFQYYFIGGALAKTDDVFEKVKAEVLFNFTFFFLVINTPYLFVSGNSVHLYMAIAVILALIIVLIILKKTNDVKLATYFFLFNFTVQDVGHYIFNNGNTVLQGILFFLLFISCGFLLLDRKWGFIITIFVAIVFIVGVYNNNTNFSLFHISPELADPSEEGVLRYFVLIPLLLNVYLLSEFVKARQKAERQLSEQKTLIEEKQKEILDSIHYALRIQKSLLPTDVYIEKSLERITKK